MNHEDGKHIPTPHYEGADVRPRDKKFSWLDFRVMESLKSRAKWFSRAQQWSRLSTELCYEFAELGHNPDSQDHQTFFRDPRNFWFQ